MSAENQQEAFLDHSNIIRIEISILSFSLQIEKYQGIFFIQMESYHFHLLPQPLTLPYF